LLVHDLPIAKTSRQITPGDARSVSVKDRINKQPIIRCIAAHAAFTAGQEVLDPLPRAAWVGSPQSRLPMNHSTTDLGIPNIPTALNLERRSALESRLILFRSQPN
jgi:hypothetical protein